LTQSARDRQRPSRGDRSADSGHSRLGNLHLDFTDPTIPAAGIPIAITRSDDTLDVNHVGDFGNGRDYSSVRVSRHALERFVERFGANPESAEESLRKVLGRTRRLGRNPQNGAIAVLAVHGDRALVAILQESTCLTVLTWNQFVPRLGEFGRTKMPRKWGRFLSRLVDTPKPEGQEEP
jgi:hypothetical protein